MSCINIDKANSYSAIIVKRENRGHAVGYWQGITTTESQDYNYHVGASVHDSQTQSVDFMSTSAAYELGLGVENGFAFDSATNGMTHISKDYWNTLKHDLQSVYGFKGGIDNKTKCTAYGNDGAGVWQWVYTTSDGAASAYSTHTVCRRGDLSFIEPECPYFACLNADCSECASDWIATQ